VEVTLEDYLAENPGKTEDDFRELKAISDGIYLEQTTDENRQTRENVSINGLEDIENFSGETLEEEFIERPEREAEENNRRMLASQALDKLTEVQRRRYLLYHANGWTEEQIAESEGATQQAVSKSLYWADKKIKKFLSDVKK